MKTVRKSAIKLTKTEFDFVLHSEYPKIKQRVIQKVCHRFDALGHELKQHLVPEDVAWGNEFRDAHSKTTRGENYRQLPYVVLDYPRIRNREFMLACRTMFWWGNYFSLNFMIRLDAVDVELFISNLKKNPNRKIRVYGGDDLWEQDLDDDHFMKLHQLSEPELNNLFRKQAYIKLSRKVRFTNWDQLEERAISFYTDMLHTAHYRR
jgi:hypothetical protein